ncbi:MAG TPA: hypothetical protein EYP98_05960, partial [Planctomycetes bacterium]|nr:hypothetical protein [Planctomycetota bacterium]
MLILRLSLLTPFLLSALLVSTAFAQETSAQEASVAAQKSQPLTNEMAEAIKKEGIENSSVHRILRDMTGKIGHRLTGSDNFTKACLWAKSEFESMGIEVELEQWGEWQTIWNRGKWIGRIIEPIELDMYVATEAWTAATDGLQTAGFVAVPAADSDEALAAVKGKWVIDFKLNIDGSICKVKTRYVACGYGQREHSEYTDVFAKTLS